MTISNPGIDALRTEVSGMALGLAAFQTALNKRLDAITDLIKKGSEVTPAQLEQLRRMGEKVEKIDQEK